MPAKLNSPDDDTEGHGFKGATQDDDTEGHGFKGATQDDDDTEGHIRVNLR